MPQPPTYPGVYVEEPPPRTPTITGVGTSTAAFVGWSAKGAVDHAELVLSWSDYVRQFGGLDARSLLGYAVNQFFANGGQRAYIVRLVSSATPAKVVLGGNENSTAKLEIRARNPGAWLNDYAVITQSVTADNPQDTSRFRLLLVDAREDPTGVIVETFEDVSMLPGDRRFVENVLKAESALIHAQASGEVPPVDTAMPASGVAGEGSTMGVVPAGAKLAGGSDGLVLYPNDDEFEAALDLTNATNGIFLLDRIDLFNLLCVPGETRDTTIQTLQKFCRDRRAFLIADCAQEATFDALKTGPGNITGDNAINAAFYFPWLIAPDPLQQNQPREFPPCGFVAGLYARTDSQRGVWKAPAGSAASLTGVIAPKVRLTDAENGAPQFSDSWHRGLGLTHIAGQERSRFGMEIYSGAARGAVHRREPVPRITMGRLRAERRTAMGATPPHRRRVHARSVPPRRHAGDDGEGGLLRQVRQGNDDAKRRRYGHRQHHGRLRAAQTRRVHSAPRAASCPRHPDLKNRLGELTGGSPKTRRVSTKAQDLSPPHRTDSQLLLFNWQASFFHEGRCRECCNLCFLLSCTLRCPPALEELMNCRNLIIGKTRQLLASNDSHDASLRIHISTIPGNPRFQEGSELR